MIDEYYLYTFESTHGAIATEQILKPVGCVIMPIPRAVSSSCGISVRVDTDKIEEAKSLFAKKSELRPAEYRLLHITHDKSDKENGFHYEVCE